MATHLHDFSLDYSGKWQQKLGKHAICGTVANMLSSVYAAQFIDMSAAEIKEMHEKAFKFENCVKRDYLINVLQEAFE